MLFSTTKLALAAAALASAANAQSQCSAKQTQCAQDNESLLLKCNGQGSWETQTCGDNMYCMTMNAAMIHCMLKPDNGNAPSSSKPTPTSSEESASEAASPVSSSHSASASDSSASTPAPKSKSDESSSSGALSKTNGNNVVIAAVAGLAIIGMGALF
ncbi:hypothetical protein J3B02_000421 [Coemansia erecta]|uniref:Uncharacterized protein n=1 Tax=Coemansia asiatica TaxID=1052880 RepID=A0A9W7XP97_9FUNG|nr:hypothetical protein LPJ64_001823 [Coemansia asiatica]KAJ2858209.1 hypothetical protein J3B02_000421 [Coemansia erecta]KAJ2875352.1 hypothetical protein FB639_004009 [Coemansia asiatica]